ncbi:MAG: nucleotidyltransferase family protein [Woeseia sp.]
MRAMILAAGRGERMRPLTDRRPKALLEAGGVSLVERQLRRLRDAGVETAVINLCWLGEMIVGQVGDGKRLGVRVVYSPEYEQVLETGGGIRRALPLLGEEPFWVVNGDVFSDMALPSVDLATDCVAHLILVPTPHYKSRGDFDLHGGRVRCADEPRYTFSGMGFYRPSLFSDCAPGRFPLAPLLQVAADRGELSGEVYQGDWEDVGTVERLQQLNERLAIADA